MQVHSLLPLRGSTAQRPLGFGPPFSYVSPRWKTSSCDPPTASNNGVLREPPFVPTRHASRPLRLSSAMTASASTEAFRMTRSPDSTGDDADPKFACRVPHDCFHFSLPSWV